MCPFYTFTSNNPENNFQLPRGKSFTALKNDILTHLVTRNALRRRCGVWVINAILIIIRQLGAKRAAAGSGHWLQIEKENISKHIQRYIHCVCCVTNCIVNRLTYSQKTSSIQLETVTESILEIILQ